MEVYKMVFSPIEVNTYILSDNSGKCAVIDCGCYNHSEFGKLQTFLAKKNIEPVLLLNTHCHLDHVFGNRLLLEKYNLGTYCHMLEEENRKDSFLHARMFGLEMEEPPEPAGFLSGGQVITFSHVTLKVLHVPGHSPGSLAFYCEKDCMVFTGDALFSGSIGRTDLPGGSFDTLINSIRNNLFTLPLSTVVYPGHGNKTTIENEIRTNPYFIKS
jgi:hydroxyacylglutathione hydrolase